MSNIPIHVTVRHLDEPSSKFQSVIQDEVGKLETYFQSISSFSVVVEGISKVVNGAELSRKVEITAIAKGNTFAAMAEEENFGKALDCAVAKMKTQLAKHHEKASDHKGIPAAEVAQ